MSILAGDHEYDSPKKSAGLFRMNRAQLLVVEASKINRIELFDQRSVSLANDD